MSSSKRPRTFDFDSEEDAVPEGFFHHDIKTKNCHHLMFVNELMINILSCTRNWFVDGTFMIVKQPFTQLLNINTFIKCDKSETNICHVCDNDWKVQKRCVWVSGGDV